jgi:CRISPR/Cas system-associated endonuclease/helicase Cas3
MKSDRICCKDRNQHNESLEDPLNNSDEGGFLFEHEEYMPSSIPIKYQDSHSHAEIFHHGMYQDTTSHHHHHHHHHHVHVSKSWSPSYEESYILRHYDDKQMKTSSKIHQSTSNNDFRRDKRSYHSHSRDDEAYVDRCLRLLLSDSPDKFK